MAIKSKSFLYGELNKELEKNNYIGKDTDTTYTKIDNGANTVEVIVKDSIILDKAEITADKYLVLKSKEDTEIVRVSLSDFQQAGGVNESYTISAWDPLSGKSPFAYQAEITATATIGDNTEVGVVNDNPLIYVNYGIVVGAVSGQKVTVWAIDKPTEAVDITILIRG